MDNVTVLQCIDYGIPVILLIATISGLISGLIEKIVHVVAAVAAYFLATMISSHAKSQAWLVYIVSFFVIFAAFKFLGKLIKMVDKIKVIGWIDHIGGAIAGFVGAFVVVFVLVNLVFGMLPEAILSSIHLGHADVTQTIFLKYFITK